MEPSPPPTSGPQLIFHYTLRQHYQGMLRDGAIQPATAYAPQAKRAAVWFTSRADWDPIVNKAIVCADETRRVLNRDELHTIGLGPMRLGVSARVAPLTWHDFKRASGNPPKVSSILVDAAARCQSHPSNWFATFEPVPQSEWLAVEQWDGWRWVPV
ncbi:MAG TPA: hypothetical protein VN699_20175 [Pirellulales bacterium]|nr:hypothetical protein [Pirellulales bacterium]